MLLITLHDQMNPANEVEVDAESIVTIGVLGSGSVLQVSEVGPILVHETPSEVMDAIRRAELNK